MARESTFPLNTGGCITGHKLADVTYDDGLVKDQRVVILMSDGQYIILEERSGGWAPSYVAVRFSDLEMRHHEQAARVEAIGKAIGVAQKKSPDATKRGRGRPRKKS